MKWISVKDRLPENKVSDYLVYRPTDGVSVETWLRGEDKGYWWDYMGITHWMPLPEPPTNHN